MSIRYLHNIVELANIRFQKMTKQRFKLILKGKDNDFYVIDYLNGGKERSIKSLGGGQTFQACLALALALSENIRKLAAIDQQFFFLDEGFGTLDKNALTLVFDTLKSLKNENRVVGLISHVEELQQEMDVFLKIENHLEKGSVIVSSWN
jgi:exonuclease SbcC